MLRKNLVCACAEAGLSRKVLWVPRVKIHCPFPRQQFVMPMTLNVFREVGREMYMDAHQFPEVITLRV